MTSEKIFIQMAAYRDPQLIPTIHDCLKKAKHPERLHFCIAWQHAEEDEWDTLDEFRTDSRFTIIDIPHNESQGACWARNLIQQLYNNETYTLQLDSHHRFIENWDEECITMLKDLQSKGVHKPLITSYLPAFDPNKEPEFWTNHPWKMNFDKFIPEGAVFFLPGPLQNYPNHSEPLPARFYSAHFAFTLGQFCKEVPHDPNYYFHGEEISIAARAYTWGYDLFHPHKILAWHEYTRNNRIKQWDDDKTWGARNESSHRRNRKLFQMDNELLDVNFGRYGFGPVRTLSEYEKYAGIDFKRRAVQQYTVEGKIPPNPPVSKEDEHQCWERDFHHCFSIERKTLKEKDYNVWVIAYLDITGNELYRKDVKEAEIQRYMEKDEWISICRNFKTHTQPSHVIFWPHSKSKGWLQKRKRTV